MMIVAVEGANITFEELYQNEARRVYNYIYGCILNREATEDIVSETFMAAMRNWEAQRQEIQNPAGWLTQIAKNKMINYLNRAQTKREFATETLPERGNLDVYPSDEYGQLKNPDNQRIFAILCKLSEDEREFLELRYALELSNREIGRLLNISEKAVSERYRRLLEKCRRLAPAKK